MHTRYLFMLLSLALSQASFAQVEYKPKPADPAPVQTTEQKFTKKIPSEPPRLNIIKMNLLSPIFSTLMLTYQRQLTTDNSFQVSAGYMDFNGFSNSNSSNSSNKTDRKERSLAFFVTPEFRYIFQGENMAGTFIGPFLKYTYMNFSESYKTSTYTYSGSIPSYTYYDIHNSTTYNSLGIGITVGHQQTFRNRISLEAFAGPVYNILLAGSNSVSSTDDIKISDTFSPYMIRGYGVRAGMTIGFMF